MRQDLFDEWEYLDVWKYIRNFVNCKYICVLLR